jgi:chromate transport protein ChrA
MFSKTMKIIIPSIVAIIVIYLYIKFINSVDLAIKYSVFPLILAFLFYYDFTLAIIATVIFSAIFIYNMKYSKKVNYRKKTGFFCC